ncbi:MAG: thiamine phosphate synthase [Eubacteriales bacterium]
MDKTKLKQSLLLYAVTDRKDCGREKFLDDIEKALAGGVTMLQLREKHLSDDELLREGEEVLGLCQKYGVPLIINDRADIAAKIGADGVHVGAEDMEISEIRQKYGDEIIVGATAKTVGQAKKAQECGADYLGVGAVFPSPTKQNARRITLSDLRDITSSVKIPSVAIGGISAENIHELSGGGMCGFAVVSAVFSAEDITKAAKKLKKLAEEIAGGKAQ